MTSGKNGSAEQDDEKDMGEARTNVAKPRIIRNVRDRQDDDGSNPPHVISHVAPYHP
jgi:hypothetical protein